MKASRPLRLLQSLLRLHESFNSPFGSPELHKVTLLHLFCRAGCDLRGGFRYAERHPFYSATRRRAPGLRACVPKPMAFASASARLPAGVPASESHTETCLAFAVNFSQSFLFCFFCTWHFSFPHCAIEEGLLRNVGSAYANGNELRKKTSLLYAFIGKKSARHLATAAFFPYSYSVTQLARQNLEAAGDAAHAAALINKLS